MTWPFGDGLIGAWHERRRAFRDLKRISVLEDAIIGLREDNPLHRAKVSMEVDDPKSAREFLKLARIRIPNYVLTSPDTVEILLGLGEFTEVEAFALDGAKRFPKSPHYLEGYALAADRQHQFEEAARRWAVVRRKFPRRKLAYAMEVGCLRQLGRLDEAEDLLRTAMRWVPEDLPILFEYCRVAETRGDWEAAYRRWDSLKSRNPAGFVGAAQALQKLGRTAEAEALLAEARGSWPTLPGIAIMNAWIAEDAGNIAEALRRWAVVRQRFPLDQAGYREANRLLRAQENWMEADAIAEAAIERFHAHSWPMSDYAVLAQLRNDWPEAAKRWAALRGAFPDREDAQKWEAAALENAALHPAGAASSVTSPPPRSS
jgi:tetratricopeptide (TPR) repeat protein